MALPLWLLDLWDVHYVKAIAIALGSYIAMQLVLWVSEEIFLKIAAKTKMEMDDVIVRRLRWPLALLVFFIGIRIAANVLQFSERANLMISEVANSLIVLGAAWVISRSLNIGMDSFGRKLAQRTKSPVDDGLLHIGHRFVGILLFFLAVTAILKVWGVQVGPLLASLGIAGIAVAFALQNTLGNIFGGVGILLDKSSRIGDTIQLDDGTVGRVTRISLRSTKIRTLQRTVVTIPNSQMADSKIENFTRRDRQRFAEPPAPQPEHAREVGGTVPDTREGLNLGQVSSRRHGGQTPVPGETRMVRPIITVFQLAPRGHRTFRGGLEVP